MRIKPNQNFKDGEDIYLKDHFYEVPEEDAVYFTANGWVGDPQPPRTHTLDIHDGELGHVSEVK